MQYQTSTAWSSYNTTPTRSMSMSMSVAGSDTATDPLVRIQRLASENAVVIFSLSTCCMCHVIKRLFSSMGVSPTVHELDHIPHGKDIERALIGLLGGHSTLPVVFIGGKLVGTMDRVMNSHINGTLIPLLKQVGALWL